MLVLAACYGHRNAVDMLLQLRADPNKVTPFGSPLGVAAHNDHVDIVEVVLRHSAEVETPNSKGDTPLLLACAHGGSAELLRALIDWRADVNHRTQKIVKIADSACTRS